MRIPGASSTPGGGWTPVPDPTKLTDEAINRATVQYRRELDALRELLSERIVTALAKHDNDIAAVNGALDLRAEARENSAKALRQLLEARVDAMGAAVDRRFEQVAEVGREHATARDKAISALQAVVSERIGAMDKATQLLASDVRQVPTLLQSNITALRELMESKLSAMEQAVVLQNKQAAMFPVEIRTEITHLRSLHEEKFASIAQQFSERDIRTDQASKAAKEALDAALQAAKELVNAQGEASSAAAVKSETSFTKQIDQIGTIISTLEKALDARITELKERIDRGEGSTAGQVAAVGSPFEAAQLSQAAESARAAGQRAVMALVISGVLLVLTFASLIFAVTRK